MNCGRGAFQGSWSWLFSVRIGWLPQSGVDRWRQGRADFLEQEIATNLNKLSTALRLSAVGPAIRFGSSGGAAGPLPFRTARG